MNHKTQYVRVRKALKFSKWKTLERLSFETLDPEASISARIRDIRANEWPFTDVELKKLPSGLFKYRLKKIRGGIQ